MERPTHFQQALNMVILQKINKSPVLQEILAKNLHSELEEATETDMPDFDGSFVEVEIGEEFMTGPKSFQESLNFSDELLNHEGLPDLRLSVQYLEARWDGSIESYTETYLTEKLKATIWMLKCIEHRQKAILNTAKSIVRY